MKKLLAHELERKAVELGLTGEEDLERIEAKLEDLPLHDAYKKWIGEQEESGRHPREPRAV